MEYQEVDKLTVLPNKNSPINKTIQIKYAKLEKGSRVLGSMTKRKRNIAEIFYFWMVQFLRKKYENIEVYFILHDSVAEFVTESQLRIHFGLSHKDKVLMELKPTAIKPVVNKEYFLSILFGFFFGRLLVQISGFNCSSLLTASLFMLGRVFVQIL